MNGPLAVEIETLGADARTRRNVERALALAAGAPLADARALLARLPARDPRAFASIQEAQSWADRLTELGASARVVTQIDSTPCAAHPALAGTCRCAGCEAPICTLCAIRGRCPACLARLGRKRRFFRARVAVLLTILVGVLLYAWRDLHSRSARNDWTRTLRVAVVVAPLEAVDEETIAALRTRVAFLEQRLAEEMGRHGRGAHAPFTFIVVTAPVGAIAAAPEAPDPDDLLGAARFSWNLHRFTTTVDEATGIDDAPYDARVYLVTRAGRGTVRHVEGIGQSGGRIGLVEVDLDAAMIDLALFVAAHELFHVLGASDKYAPTGEVLAPEGLADPSLEPLFPQRDTELMARQRPLSPRQSVLPESLDELRVGEATAREIGWR